MKNISRALLTCCLLLFSAGPALAELEVTFVNRTGFEIQAISMKGDGGGMTSAIRVVPGNFCVFTDGNASKLHEVAIDVGLMLFTFTDMAALAGNAKPTLELAYDADGRPRLTLADNPGQAASGSVPEGGSLVNVVGTTAVFADPSTPAETAFAAILGAGNLGEIRAMGARDSSLWSSQVYLPATFAGKTWAVFIESAESFSRDDADKPGACVLRAYTGGPEGVGALMRSLAAEGLRPWFAQRSAGGDMDMAGMVKFREENPDAGEAWKLVTDAAVDVNRDGKPAAVDAVLLTEKGYAGAAKGGDAAFPGFRLRVSNADVVVLQYLPDASGLIFMTR